MKVNYQSKNQVVYDQIRNAIISGEIAPGARIVIDDLATQLQVSHSPIRECLRQLASDGFVTIQPYAGVTVTELPASFMIEVFAILEAMEIISSSRACLLMTPEQFDEIESLLARMSDQIDQPEEWSKSNKELHLSICDYAETTLIKDTMHKALWHWDRLRRHYLQDVSIKRIGAAHQEHLDIIAAMRTQDVNLVEDIIRKHNRAALADYLKYIDAD